MSDAKQHYNYKHGQARPESRGPTYRSWECMKSRCSNVNDPSYEDYGGRGIGFYEPWSDFREFLKDMGERLPGTSLDRIDCDGDYEPGNCRWADAKTQGRNKRNNRVVVWRGKMLTMVELAEATGEPYQRLHERIVRRGWPVERAVAEPPRGFR